MDNLRTIAWLSHMSKLSLRLSPDQPNPWFFPSRSTERKNNALPVSQTDRLISYGQVDLHGFVGRPWYINGLVDWENTYGSRFRFSQENQSIEIYHEKTWKTSPCEISLSCMVIVENFVGYITKKKFLTHIKYMKYSYWKWPGIIIDLPIKHCGSFPSNIMMSRILSLPCFNQPTFASPWSELGITITTSATKNMAKMAKAGCCLGSWATKSGDLEENLTFTLSKWWLLSGYLIGSGDLMVHNSTPPGKHTKTMERSTMLLMGKSTISTDFQ